MPQIPDDKTEMQTLLSVPIELRERILRQADRDRRMYKPEILVLLEEACAAREKAGP